MKNIYVGNLPFTATEQDVKALFDPYGTVLKVHLISDRETGRARGFGFVEMEDDGAQDAIDALNERDFKGRPLQVNEARERPPRPAGQRRFEGGAGGGRPQGGPGGGRPGGGGFGGGRPGGRDGGFRSERGDRPRRDY